ncbi:MAG: sulfatase/phosphatase domain-containing protein, partial [Candidatus Aminicenantales bacterium]
MAWRTRRDDPQLLRLQLDALGAARRLRSRTQSRSCQDLVSHEDIFPTVCDLLGLPKPADVPGRSFRPLLEGRPRKAQPVYFEALEAYYHRGAAPLRGVISGSMKFMDSPIPELYDLVADFNESRNLASTTDLAPYRKI